MNGHKVIENKIANMNVETANAETSRFYDLSWLPHAG